MPRNLALVFAALLFAAPATAQEEEPTELPAEEPTGAASPETEPGAGDDESGADGGEEPVGPPAGDTETRLQASSSDAAPAAPSGPHVGRMPSLRGATGLFQLLTADSVPHGTFALGLFGEFFTGVDVVRSGDEDTRFGGHLTLAWAAHPNVEVFASLSGAGNVSNFADPQLIQTQGDVNLGGKGFAPFGEGFGAGLAATIVLLNGQNDVGVDFSATSLDVRGLFKYDLQAARGVPLQIHFNASYFLDNSDQLFDFELQRVERFAHNISDYDLFSFGLGFEVPLRRVTPSLEWRFGIPVGSDAEQCAESPVPCPGDAGAASYPHYLTLGIRGTPLPQLALNLGVDFGLTSEEATGLPATAPFNVLFGVTYNLDPRGGGEVATDATPAGPTGWILGEVVDAESGQPLGGAVVRYPGTEFTAQSSDPETGRFRSYEFPPDSEITVEVSLPAYETRTFSRRIPEGQDGVRIRMNPSQTISQLAGRVTESDGSPLAATIHLRGPESSDIPVDPLSAEFEAQLPIGRYLATVAAPGHVSRREELELAPGPVQWEPTLERLPEGRNARLLADRIDLGDARVTFIDNGVELEMDSEAILGEVADLLQRHGDIRLNVIAHSDDSGTVEHTEAQAQAVVEFLRDAGIDPARLSAEGAGGSRPQLPNINARNRARNWRVELIMLP